MDDSFQVNGRKAQDGKKYENKGKDRLWSLDKGDSLKGAGRGVKPLLLMLATIKLLGNMA